MSFCQLNNEPTTKTQIFSSGIIVHLLICAQALCCWGRNPWVTDSARRTVRIRSAQCQNWNWDCLKKATNSTWVIRNCYNKWLFCNSLYSDWDRWDENCFCSPSLGYVWLVCFCVWHYGFGLFLNKLFLTY